VICILILLVVIDPLVALIVGATLSMSYTIIYWSIRTKISKIGVAVTQLFSDRLRLVNESLGGIKELKLLGREKYYLKKFRDVSKEIIRKQIFSRTATELPKYILESIAFGGILAMTIYLVAVRDDAGTVLPMISLYGLAGYRLMPALQGVFKSTATIRHDIAAVDLFYEDIKGGDNLPFTFNDDDGREINKMPFSGTIELDGVSFNYPNTKERAIKELALSINCNDIVGTPFAFMRTIN